MAVAQMESMVADPARRVTVSIGIAECDPADTSVDAALARADASMYQAKAAGRNCVFLNGEVVPTQFQALG